MRDDKAALAAVANEIARLQVAYLNRLPAGLTELATLAAGLQGSEADRATLDDIHHRLHKLAGSAGTFGLKTLGDQARRLERTAKEWLAGNLETVKAPALTGFATGVAALGDELGDRNTVTTVTSALPETPPVSAAMAATKESAHIWLVEDDPLLAETLARQLTQFGYEVRTFGRIGDAEAAAESGRPDILIMDVMLSAENVDATVALTAGSPLQALGCPLIFISAHGDFASRVRAARLGAEGFLLKPIDVPKLVDQLESIADTQQANPYRILLVDDDADLTEHFRLVMTAVGMEVEVLNTPERILDRISDFRPELVLLDLDMPGYSGPELATVIRHHDNWIGLPIVYLSAETDLDRQLQALGRVADDFISKPISDAHLIAAVRNRVTRSRQLADLMFKDSLTGLLKHSRIKEEVEIELARSRRAAQSVSVAMIDIDHFKRVNDTYGHAVGDQVIKAIAHLLRQRLRMSDCIGRYGGEEFVALLPDCNAITAIRVIEDIRTRFAALRFRHGEQEFSCTLSAGIACSGDLPDQSSSELLNAADQALYAAKHGGRNQVRVASDGAGKDES